jgi:hypothetical protein
VHRAPGIPHALDFLGRDQMANPRAHRAAGRERAFGI